MNLIILLPSVVFRIIKRLTQAEREFTAHVLGALQNRGAALRPGPYGTWTGWNSHWAPCRAAAKTHLCQPFWVLRFQSPRRETYGLSTKSGRQAASCLTVPPNCTQLERNSSPNINRGAITKTAKWSRGKKCLPGAPVRMPHPSHACAEFPIGHTFTHAAARSDWTSAVYAAFHSPHSWLQQLDYLESAVLEAPNPLFHN